jgi:ParB family chromosome partitioning protein
VTPRKARGLGRGMGSLIPLGSNDDVIDVREIPVSAVEANEYQPREAFDEDALGGLTDSVRELGVLQPILVRPSGTDSYELIAGERRWRAARRAGLSTIPAVVRDINDQTSLEHALVENLHRQDLNALEEAAAYQQLIDEFGLTQEQVATRTGKSRSAVANTLRLFQLPGAVQRMVAVGELTAGHARALLGFPDAQFQLELAERVLAEGLNVRQVEGEVRKALGKVAEPEVKPLGTVRAPSAAELEVQDVLGSLLDTRVNVEQGTGVGKIVISFADDADLERIFRAIAQAGHSQI